MIKFTVFILCPLLLVPLPAAQAAPPAAVPMTADRWQINGNGEFQQYKGVSTLMIKQGNALLKDLAFNDGTIEFDVVPTRGGPGVGFRRHADGSFEEFYIRASPDCAQNPQCTQYAPVLRGVLLWDMYPQYQSTARLRVAGEWNHVKLVVSGRRMNVFVNGTQTPTLKIGRLEGDPSEGGILFDGPGNYANLVVTPGATEGLPATPDEDPTAKDGRYVRKWQLAAYHGIPADKEPIVSDMPGPSNGPTLLLWRPIAAEDFAMVNISREYTLPFPPTGARMVTWLKTTITSDKVQKKKTSIGWVREVWVFVNGKLAFADKNLFQPPSARKAPDGRFSIENGSFPLPLNAGDNEVVVALVNDFYGWGLTLRLDDLDGVTLKDK